MSNKGHIRELMCSLLLRLFSICGGVAGFIGLYYGNPWILKIGTVIAGMFCLQHADFVATVADRFSRKIYVILLGSFVAWAVNRFLEDPVADLGWMIVCGLFTLFAVLTFCQLVEQILEDAGFQRCGWIELLFSLLLRVLSICAGVAGFIGLCYGNLWLLKAGTVIAGMFCMWQMGPYAIGAKLKIIGIGSLISIVINLLLKSPVTGLGWMLIDAAFIFNAVLSVPVVFTDLQCAIEHWNNERKQSKT